MSRSAVNRTILAVVGLTVLVTGVLALAGGLDLYGRLGVTTPVGWPFSSPHQRVLSDGARNHWSSMDWWWPVVLAVPAVLIAGGLWWIYAQLHRTGPTMVEVPVPDGTGVALRLRSKALEDAIETEAVALPDVERVTAKVGGGRRLTVRTAVRLGPGGGVGEAVAALDAGPFTHARSSLGLTELPAEVRLKVAERRRQRRSARPPGVG
ncbi:alkaline shock response membrane anchor protein AmaP [Kitasatospora sp. NPDC059571]|uniref:alkaline shock response membrane anchor protein AmaP n=1 Tax=Kitasatospora sp. NPDC059571 TaxID=3346871 RepID=UPI0036B3FA61